MKVKAVKAAADSAKLRKKSQSIPISKLIKFLKKAQGKKSFAKVSGNKNITVNKKTGSFTLKKGLQKGTYKVRLKVKAAGNTNYKAAAKTVAVYIAVK